MGRVRIKKKGTVLPFRQTVAYRFLLIATASITMLIAAFQLIFSIQSSSLTAALIWGVVLVGAAVALLYNLAHMREAKIPKSALERMKRR